MTQFFISDGQSIKSFSFSISLSNEHSGLISFRMDWLELLAVQGTLRSLLQHHSSKVSILWCSAFCMVQLSHPYMATRKTIAWTRWTVVGKVMSLCCLTPFRLPLNPLHQTPSRLGRSSQDPFPSSNTAPSSVPGSAAPPQTRPLGPTQAL